MEKTTKTGILAVVSTGALIKEKIVDALNYLKDIAYNPTQIDMQLAASWMTELMALFGILITAVMGYDKFFKKAPSNTKPVIQKERTKSYFRQAELECKGMHCDCTFPGMDGAVMAIANDVRDVFGAIIVNSAYRCKKHNLDVGGEEHSYHPKAMALDVRSPTHSPKKIYDYLINKYPDQYGFGLYKNFVHIDSRGPDVYARKPTPDAFWREWDVDTSGETQRA